MAVDELVVGPVGDEFAADGTEARAGAGRGGRGAAVVQGCNTGVRGDARGEIGFFLDIAQKGVPGYIPIPIILRIS